MSTVESKKKITFTSTAELKRMRNEIILRADRVALKIQALLSEHCPFSALAELRFEKTVVDEVFNESMNIEEYLNQTFTYLVCLYAGAHIMERFPGKSVTIHFGNLPGTDVYSIDQTVACECFAAVSAKNNDKLRKEASSLHKSHTAAEKHVFFYTHSQEADRAYIEKVASEFSDVTIHSIPFASLTNHN